MRCHRHAESWKTQDDREKTRQYHEKPNDQEANNWKNSGEFSLSDQVKDMLSYVTIIVMKKNDCLAT